MVTGVWGKKIGMTQMFKDDKVVPVTAVDVSNWRVTNLRTAERDGYNAVQVGYVRQKFRDQAFTKQWLKSPKKYFSVLREIKLDSEPENITLGQEVDFLQYLEEGKLVDVFGKTRGRGFAGVVKRHRFGGPPGSHGSKMGKRPGSISGPASQGHVPKGKKMPGQMGNKQRVMKNLELVKVEKDAKVLLIKGSVPGHSDSLLFIRKV